MATNTQITNEDDEDETENGSEVNPFSFKMFLNNKSSNIETSQRMPESNPLSFKHFINKFHRTIFK